MLQSLFIGFIGGVAAWFFTEFVTQPLRRFVDLRREVTRCLVVYGNVSARLARDRDGKLTTLDISPEEDARLVEAQNAFRDLAGKMRGFAHVDYIASRLVNWRGYKADAIASALIAYSNAIVAFGQPRATSHDKVQELLRIRSESGPA